MRKVIVNTTPIIALADIGYLDLLKELYGEIFIPEAVLSEIISEPAHTLVRQSDWIKVRKAPVQSQKNSFSMRLHAGEIEVLSLSSCGDRRASIASKRQSKWRVSCNKAAEIL